MNLGSLIARLQQNFDLLANAALATAAEDIAEQLRTALSTPPGGPHIYPWLQSGALHNSVAVSADGPNAVIGSDDPVALYQEHGTEALPPRPSFGPISAHAAPEAAHSVGQAIAHALGAK